jgi:hypothetical protein
MADSIHKEILRTCHLLTRQGDAQEIRVPKAGRRGIISGHFDNPEALVNAVLQLCGSVPGGGHLEDR